MGNLNSRKQNIQEGIPLIKEWIELKRQEYKENNDFSELEKIVKEIETENDYSKDAFDDIREINSIDGVRLTFEDDSWVLVRPSGTEDYVRITLESRDEKRANEINEACKRIINDNI